MVAVPLVEIPLVGGLTGRTFEIAEPLVLVTVSLRVTVMPSEALPGEALMLAPREPTGIPVEENAGDETIDESEGVASERLASVNVTVPVALGTNDQRTVPVAPPATLP